MADRLQMIAELIDKSVGANAKKIEKAFADLGKVSARDLPTALKKYQSAVTRQEKELEQFTKRSASIRREMEALKSIVQRTAPTVFELTKSLGSFASGSGAAVGAITAVGAALYEAGKVAADFSESMRQIKFGSAETGLGQLQIKQLTQALGEFGIDASEASQGFHGLKAAITEMSARTGIFKEKLARGLGNEIFNYADPIIEEAKKEGTTTAKVYAEIRKQLDRISADHPDDPALAHDLRRRLVEGMGLNPKFAHAGEAAMQEKLAVIKALGTTGEEMRESVEVAARFNALMDDGRVALDRWLTNLGASIIELLLFVNKTLDRLGIDKTRALGMLLAPLYGGTITGLSAVFDAWVKSQGLTPFAEGGIVTKPTVALIGEKEPEAVIPLRALNFIKAIGRSETDFSKSEAYSDKYNGADNNANVKQYGQSGADYGYYQMNQRDVGDAIKRGVAPGTAGHLAGGSQSTFAPTGDVSTEAQQTGAMNEYIKRRYAKQYSDLVAGGSFENMRRAVQGQWHGMRDHAEKAAAEYNMSLGGRMSMNAALGSQSAINSTGQLDVNVRAPRGTRVKAEGGGIFEKTNVRRNIQMQSAPGGPPQ